VGRGSEIERNPHRQISFPSPLEEEGDAERREASGEGFARGASEKLRLKM